MMVAVRKPSNRNSPRTKKGNEMDKKFTKLKDLVDGTFTVEKVWGYKYKAWDDLNRKMLVSDTYEKGYRKIYSVDTSEGSLDLSASQLGQMFESVQKDGSSELVGRTFAVKSNGKEGMEIRYYINPTKDEPKKIESDEAEVTKEELDALGW